MLFADIKFILNEIYASAEVKKDPKVFDRLEKKIVVCQIRTNRAISQLKTTGKPIPKLVAN